MTTKTLDQTEQRARRRKRLPVVYDGTFDLTEEINDICTPLADRVSSTPNPARFAPYVDDIVLAVAGVIRTFAAILADSEARRRTKDVPLSNRDRARRALVLVADRPADPEVDDDAVVSGQWAAILVDHARAFSDPLADLLARSFPPDAVELRGNPSMSERVETELREIDSAAIALTKRIDYAESHREQNKQTRAAKSETEDARHLLDELGITP